MGEYSSEQYQFWHVNVRQNKTIRPDSILRSFESLTVEELASKLSSQLSESNGLKFYLQLSTEIVSRDGAGHPIYFPPFSDDRILLFIKYYDPLISKMEFVSCYTIHDRSQSVSTLLPYLRKIKGLAPNSSILMYEEVKPEMIDILKTNQTFVQAELGDGDIICFQLESLPATASKVADPLMSTVPGYFDYVANKTVISFQPKDGNSTEDGIVEVQLSKKNTYDQVIFEA